MVKEPVTGWEDNSMVVNDCNAYLAVMIDPVNKALSSISRKPALTRGLLGYIKREQGSCGVCGRDKLNHVLSLYRDNGDSDCRDCNEGCITLGKLIPPSFDPIERRIQANLVSGIHRFGLKHHLVPAAPIIVTWELTSQCNMGTCAHCHMGAKTDRGSDSELTFSEAKEVVDQLAAWGVCGIAFTGGESLLWPGFYDLVKYATGLGMVSYMATNGLLLDVATIRKLKNAGLSMVHISLDGSDHQTHDHFRGYPGSYEKVIRAAEGCLEEGLQVALAATPTRINVSHMRGILQLADKLRVDWFITYNYIPSGRGGLDLDLDAVQKDQLWSDLLEESALCRKTRWLSFAPQLSVFGKISGLKNRLNATHYYEPLFAGSCQTMLRSSTACMAGRYYLAIKADGCVVPCIFLPERIGNVRDRKLADLWNESRVLENLRDRHKIEGVCGHCSHGESCGGCRARARAYTGNYMASDPHCPVAARLEICSRSIHEAHVCDYVQR